MPYFSFVSYMEKEEKKKENKKTDLATYIAIIIVVVFIRSFVVTPVRVNGSSMDTTLHNKEIMILNKLDYKFSKIKRFDIVVLKYNNDKLIKRVIGLPGETLEFKNSVLYINGEEVEEYFKNQDTIDFNIKDLGYDVIPKDCYFVMGDNRADSLDSRMIGCVSKKDILGSANLVIYPFKDFGIKK